MNRTDVTAFVHRDWARVEDAKARFWVERKRTLRSDEVLRLGDALRRHAQTVHPTWPDDADRSADLGVHVRVSEGLPAVSRDWSH